MTAVLETRRLCKHFGAITVANQIEFRLDAGDRHALIGPNGAGKTTFVNVLSGRLAPSSGEVLIDGVDVTHLAQAGRVKRGLVRTFQISTLFRSIAVVENVALAVAERKGIAWRMFRPATAYRDVLDESMGLLESLGLGGDAWRKVADLPYGKQRLLEIAIGLALQPRVLLLDEPAAGVPSPEAGRILEVLGALPAHIAILIIEHDMEFVFRFAQRITVLAQGAVLAEGPPAEIAADRRVRDVYLGERGV